MCINGYIIEFFLRKEVFALKRSLQKRKRRQNNNDNVLERRAKISLKIQTGTLSNPISIPVCLLILKVLSRPYAPYWNPYVY